MLLFIHNSIQPIHRHDLSTDDKTCPSPSVIQTFEIPIRRGIFRRISPVLLSFAYIHPQPTATEWKDSIRPTLTRIFDTNQSMILNRDLNARHKLWDFKSNVNGPRIHSLITDYGLTVLNRTFQPNIPSRPSSNSVIDLALTNDPSLIGNMKFLYDELLTSDHLPISIHISPRVSPILQPPLQRIRWNIDTANWNLYNNIIDSMIGAIETSLSEHERDNGQERIDRLTDGITIAIDTARQKSMKIIDPTKRRDWTVDPEIESAVMKMRRAKRSTYRTNRDDPTRETIYHQSVYALRHAIAAAKQRSTERFLKSVGKNATSAWDVLRKISNKPHIVPSQISDRKDHNPPGNITQSLNNLADYFSNEIFSNDAKETGEFEWSYPKIDADERWDSDSKNWITADDILAAAKEMNPRTASGRDTITIPLITHAPLSLHRALAKLGNLSISSGYYPNMWRINRAVALHKKGDVTDPSNYRIITVSSVIARIIEHCILNRLYASIKPNYFDEYQSGFRKHRSTTDNLYILIESIKLGMTKANAFPVIFLDIQKAFDSVCHRRLLQRCQEAGITGYLLRWIKSFLHDRSFIIDHNGHTSTPHPARFGVPQGSIISPLLFLIFINGSTDVLQDGSIRMLLFADDIAVFPNIINPKNKADTDRWQRSLQHTLNLLAKWSTRNLLSFHPTKSAGVYFTKQKAKPVPPILYFGALFRFKWVSSYKYLGLIFDDRMQWTEHIDSLTRSLQISASNINRVICPRDTPQPSIILSFVRAVLYGKLSYGIQFWSHGMSGEQSTKLRASIVSPLRRCLQLPTNANINSILVEFGLPSIDMLRAVSTLRYMWSIRHDTAPTPITKFYKSLQSLPPQPPSTPTNRTSIHSTASSYATETGLQYWDANDPSIEIEAASILTRKIWDTSNQLLKSLKSTHKLSHYIRLDSPSIAATRANLRSGHNLNEWRSSKLNHPTSLCRVCNTTTESADHIINHCNRYDSIRHTTSAAIKSDPTLTTTGITLTSALLGGSDDLSKDQSQILCKLTTPFLQLIHKHHLI
jgi:retron-type reverse transcriptase